MPTDSSSEAATLGPQAPVGRARATTLQDLLSGSPYVGYAYAYPHKTSYRPFHPPLRLDELWSQERKEGLFLYAHVPFCSVRCGFCNLLATSGAAPSHVDAYLETLARQAHRVANSIGNGRKVARIAVGGGTPSFLDAPQLARLFSTLHRFAGVSPGEVLTAVEVSPETVDAARIDALRAAGVNRISIGVQSFHESDARAMGRPQSPDTSRRALELIRSAEFPRLNIDLIYGADGQTAATWLDSILEALQYSPQEVFLYPLYVRPLTGLGRLGRSWDEHRLELYRAGRALLVERGYRQVSMRMFQSPDATENGSPRYCCQEDGMVGLGAGARSYTKAVHYSTEFAVSKGGVQRIIEDYVNQPDHSFECAHVGCQLDGDEQRRRFVIQSLLHAAGVNANDYEKRFGTAMEQDFPPIDELIQTGHAMRDGEVVRLTPSGMEWSDAIGPWLYSEAVARRTEAFSWR